MPHPGGPLRLGVDAIRALGNGTGLGNYSRGVLRGLHEVAPELDLHLYTPRPPRAPWATLPAELGATLHLPPGLWHRPFLRAAWRTLRLGRVAARDGITLYHGLSHEIPRDLPATGLHSVVTFLDLIYHRHPEYFPAIDRRSYAWRYRWSAEHADAIVAISAQTRDDLVEIYRIEPARIVVIPPARDPRFSAMLPEDRIAAARRSHGLPEEYLLSVGTLEPRKNQRILVEALARLGRDVPPLVLIGRDGGAEASLRALAAARGVGDRVHLLTTVTADHLPALMQGALLFLYPSLIEGFGMPIVEALSAGVPVITTAGGCFAEAGGAAARYVDPADADRLGALILEILGSADLRSRMRAEGLRHAAGYDAATLARRLLGVYDAVRRGATLTEPPAPTFGSPGTN